MISRRVRVPGVVGALLLAAVHASAQDRPLRTEDARTSPAGTLTLGIGGSWMKDEPNFLTDQRRDRWSAPQLRLTWSPASNVELDVEWVGRTGVSDDPDYGSVSDWGDVTLRTKVRLAESPGLAARFGVTLPQTSYGNGLGTNVLRMSVEVAFTQDWGGAALHVNGGLGVHEEVLRAHEQRDFLVWGVALSVPAGGRTELLAEAAGRGGDGAPGVESHGEVRAGFRTRLGPLRADAAVRRGIDRADGTWGGLAGFTWFIRGDR